MMPIILNLGFWALAAFLFLTGFNTPGIEDNDAVLLMFLSIVLTIVAILHLIAIMHNINESVKDQISRFHQIVNCQNNKKTYEAQLKDVNAAIAPLIDNYGEFEKNLFSNIKDAPKLLATKIDDDRGYADLLKRHLQVIKELTAEIHACERKINHEIQQINTNGIFTIWNYALFIPRKYRQYSS